ncbi:hypothetical protein ScPMuIL_008293 [Solemya velum]
MDDRSEETDDESSHLILKSEESTPGYGRRHVLAFMCFLGFVNVYCLRVNLSVALVNMVNSTNSRTNDSSSQDCSVAEGANATTPKHGGEFNWDQSTQGWILGAFFYGYITTQLPGGWLAERFGGKKLFGFGVLCTSILTLLTPIAARYHLGALLAVRVLEGIGEGVTFPAVHAMWGKWAPIFERSKLVSFCYAGAQLGTVVSMPLSGILCDSNFLGGWPSAFYVFGALGCIWFVAWMLIVHDTPADHPRISVEEREYIESSIGVRQKLSVPWKSIFTSIPVWSIAAGHVANNWGFYTMLTCLPTYMKEILKFDIKQNGFMSALPYLLCWIVQVLGGILADCLRSRRLLSTVYTRKLIGSFGLLAPAVLFVCIQFAGCDHEAVIAIITLAVGLGGFTMGGIIINHLDIAPNYSGTLMGFSNGLATIPGFLGPVVVGQLTNGPGMQTRAQWQIVFYIAAAINTAGTLIYLMFAKGDEQPWNSPDLVIMFKGIKTQVQYDNLAEEPDR